MGFVDSGPIPGCTGNGRPTVDLRDYTTRRQVARSLRVVDPTVSSTNLESAHI